MTETPDIIARLRQDANHREKVQRNPILAALLREAAEHIAQQSDWRRAFLERAVCHPGPPMSEQEDYDPDADLSELEGSVLERMDMETRWHRELMEIRREAEDILARAPDPSRSTVQVFKDLLAHFIAFHQHLEERVTAAIALLNSSLVSRENIERAELLLRRGAAVDVDNGPSDAVAEHILAAGGDPESATVAQIADALNATSEGVTFTVNEAGDGVNWRIDQKGVASTIEVVGGDRIAELGLAPPAVKLQWDSPDTFELEPPKRITIDLRQPATPPTPEEEAENAAYMARISG
jgi:hypothetical protein